MAIAGFGCKLQRGEGGGIAAVKASVTLGTSNSQVKFTARNAGTGGNSITVAVVVSGNSTPLSVSVTNKAITINAATNGSGTAISTAAQIIDAVNAKSQASQLVLASKGAGDGTGVIAAASSTALTSGADTTEVFVDLPEVGNMSFSGEQASQIDVTTMGVTDRRRQYIAGPIDPGTFDAELFYVPSNYMHDLLRQDLESGTVRNWRILLSDTPTTVLQFQAFVSNFAIDAQAADAVKVNLSLQVSGALQRIE